MIGFEVSTATRSTPVGASCERASGEGTAPICAQPAKARDETAARNALMGNIRLGEEGCMIQRVDAEGKRLPVGLINRLLLATVLSLVALACGAADFPAPKEGSWTVRDFKFHGGE